MIFSHVKHNGRHLDERIDLNKHNFFVAFSVDRIVQGGIDFVNVNDPDLTEWSIFMEEKDLSGKTHMQTPVRSHKCAQEEY